MNNNKIFTKIRKMTKRQLTIIGVIIISVFFLYLYLNKPSDSPYEFTVVSKTDIVDEISVTGRVKASQSIDLAFEKSGKISGVFVKVGDTVYKGQLLASLSSAELTASLDQAKANLETEEIKLDEIKKGTRQEEIKVSESKLKSAVASVEDAKNSLYNNIQDAYTKSDDAIKNKVDQFIYNPQSPSPTLAFSTSFQLKNEIESKRVSVENILISWKKSIDTRDSNEIDPYTKEAKKNLDEISSFLGKVAMAVNDLTPSSSLSQATIDTYKSATYTARSNINTTKTSLLSSEEKLRTKKSALLIAEDELLLKKAGATPEAILTQESKIKSARANVANIKAQITKTIIYSPISGIVTKQDFKVGEITSANITSISLISKEDFKIEANIPEADISRVKIGNTAKITLDAYGEDEVFDAEVIAIDPAETILEGVATYKTTLEFLDGKGKVKSGMTANIDILSAKKEGVLAIPARAISNQDNRKIVQILVSGTQTETIKEVEVKTGLRSSDGLVEIIEGLSEGDKVVTFINK